MVKFVSGKIFTRGEFVLNVFLKIRQSDLSSSSFMFNFLDIYRVYSTYLKKTVRWLRSEEEAPYTDKSYKKLGITIE